MPNIFDISFDQQAVDLLPPDKRDTQKVQLLRSWLGAVQWCRDLVLGGFKIGHFAPKWAPGAYTLYFQVVYFKAIYECIVDGTTQDPTTSDWRLIQPNFIGIDERIYYNGQTLVLEYALNKNFDGTFRQPGSSSLSDIYLTNNTFTAPIFRVGADEFESSTVSTLGSSEYIGVTDNISQQIDFAVHVPIAIYAIQGSTDKIFRNFIDKYIPAGITYEIVTY